MRLDELLLSDVNDIPKESIPDALGVLAAVEARLRLRLESNDGDPRTCGLMKPEQVAELLGVKVHFVYERARRGELKAVKLGTHVRFHLEDVQKFIEEKRG